MITQPIAAPSPQLPSAMALTELLTAHPDLPAATWSHPEYAPGELVGQISSSTPDPFGDLAVFASRFGGSIAPTRDFTFDGRTHRIHQLRTVWRGVDLVVSVSVPLGASGGRGAAMTPSSVHIAASAPDTVVLGSDGSTWKFTGYDPDDSEQVTPLYAASAYGTAAPRHLQLTEAELREHVGALYIVDETPKADPR